MNWTEGNLFRHSRSRQRNELLTRQKQHFAKVRNNLLKGGVKRSPISISFFGTQHLRNLERREDSGGPTHRLPSSPLLAEKRKRTRDSLGDVEHKSSTREKRRVLLGRADWAGLNLQQPIDITFPGQPQASTGSRWGKVERPRIRTTRKHHEDAEDVSRNDAIQSLKIQIGSQEIRPSLSTSSKSKAGRYSLAPQPLAGSSRERLNPISSPEPSRARCLYAVSRRSESLQLREHQHQQHRRTKELGDLRTGAVNRAQIPEQPTHVVYSSSVIHEPTPLRANHFTVLRWSPLESEDRGSMKVEVDRPARTVPLSQEADQERWRGWIDNSSAVRPGHRPTISPTVASPANSNLNGLPSHLQRRLPSFEISSETDTGTSYPCPEPNTSDEETEAAVHGNSPRFPENRSDQDQNATQPVDDNLAWMNFAFNGNSDELGAKAFAEAAHRVAAELHPSETSISPDDATKTSTTAWTDCLVSDDSQSKIASPISSGESHRAIHGTAASDSVLSNRATVGSTSVGESESRFRFAQPRTFVGKLVNSNTTRTEELSLISNHTRKRRGRPKKRAMDGRTDIRRLPDFDGDPIEEF